MGLISGYSDDAATTDTDRFLTYASDGTTKLTPGSNLKSYLGISSGSTGIADAGTTLQAIRAATTFDFIEPGGCVLSGTGYGSTLAWSLTAGVVWIAGKRLTVTAASGTVTASKDTYFDLLDPGSGTVATLVNTGGNIVNNNVASPTLAASSVRAGIIAAGANIASVASVNQGQEDRVLPIISLNPLTTTDALGNLICPRDPVRRTLGYRQAIATQGSISTSDVIVTALSETFIAPGDRKVLVTGTIPSLSDTAAAGAFVSLYNAATVTGSPVSIGQIYMPTLGTGNRLQVEYEYTPAAGTQNFCLAARVSAGTGTINGASTSISTLTMKLV